MSLDYNKVWEVMNDLDEVVQRTKIINDMCTKLRKTVYDWTDADEVIDEIDALKGFSTYILQELEDKSINAWNNTVVPLNPNKPSLRIGGDLDSLDSLNIKLPDDCTVAAQPVDFPISEGVDYIGLSTENIDISTVGVGTETYNVSLNLDETSDTITFDNSGYTYRLDELQE
tara:strand:+ start:455 stop:970 length:516 start_codon:yes stop_codon:yes gene_type:complete